MAERHRRTDASGPEWVPPFIRGQFPRFAKAAVPLWSVRAPEEIAVPAALVEQISLLVWCLGGEGANHPFYRMSPKTWRREVNDRVEKLRRNPDDDEALIELCKLDPRYLGTDLAIAKIMRWKLQVIWSEIVIGRPSERSKEDRERLSKVTRKLDRIARSVRHTSGKGQKDYRLRSFIRDEFDHYVRCFEQIREKLRTKFTDAHVREIAKDFSVPERTVRDLRNARRVEGIVDEYLADRHGISSPRFRALRTGGRRSKRS